MVDVGGGVGTQSLQLAHHHPQLRFVIQDRESVVGDAIEVCALINHSPICPDDIYLPQYWKRNMPDALESGRVKIQGSSFSLLYTSTSWFRLTIFGFSKGQNFLDPQPTWHTNEDNSEGVSVFLLSRVLHDWSDEYCLTILKHLRAAAGPKTQLVIVEMMISFVCDEPAAHEVPGAELPVPPQPLLRNMGSAALTAYITDLQVRGQKENSNYEDDMTDMTFPSFYLTCRKMMSFFNGQERTVTYLRDLLNKAGWKLIAVHYDKPSVRRYQKAIAVPN